MWDEATRDADPFKATVYSPQKKFREHEFEIHPRHGLGVVQAVGETTITVLFREGFQQLDFGHPQYFIRLNRRRVDELDASMG